MDGIRLMAVDKQTGDSVASARLVKAAAIAVVLSLFIVIGTGVQSYVELSMRGQRVDNIFLMVRWRLIWWSAWALLTPFVFEFAWRHPFRRAGWLRIMALLLLGNVVAYSVHVAIQVAAMYLPAYQMVHDSFADAVGHHVAGSLYLNVFIYWAIVLVANALWVYADTQRRALRAANLETQLANARLETLKSQLHPHFLFNTLHGIATLMHRDVDSAERMINQFSGLLRRALDRSDVHEVTLGEELAFLREYLDIEQMRFGNRMEVDIRVPADAEELLVPSFVLQPLVENSLKHGVHADGVPGRIEIVAARKNERLELIVLDDGPGIADPETAAFSGVGLSNLSSRLQRMHGALAELVLENRDTGGLRVTVVLPIRDSSQATAFQPTRTRPATRRLRSTEPIL